MARSTSVWNWYISNGQATASQTQAAYSAVQNKGSLSNFSYLVWNDIVDKVSEISTEVWGYSKSGSLENSYMTSSSKVMTASRYNTVMDYILILERQVLGASSGYTTRKTGDTMYGSYFTELVRRLNVAIAAYDDGSSDEGGE